MININRITVENLKEGGHLRAQDVHETKKKINLNETAFENMDLIRRPMAQVGFSDRYL
jgi:hypothetical protein